MKKYRIESDCEDLKYREHLTKYLNKHNMSEMVVLGKKLAKPTNDSEEVQIKLEIEGTKKVECIPTLHYQICDLLNATPPTLQIFSIEEGCLTVSFLVPANFSNDIMEKFKKKKKECRSLSILWIRCKGQIIDLRDPDYGECCSNNIIHRLRKGLFNVIVFKAKSQKV